jgi:2-haloacid dehalogenase
MIVRPNSRVHAICFDAFGTLIDISTVNAFLEQQFPTEGQAIGAMWRVKQIDYSRLRSTGRKYKPFGEITRDALIATLYTFDIHPENELISELMNQYKKSTTYLDTHQVLNELSAPWSVVTNGDRPFVSPILQSAGINVSEEALITSDQVEDFKVAPALYQLAFEWAKTKGVKSTNEVLFVSANQWDAIGATWFGFTTCWINRNAQTPEILDVEPTFEVKEFADVLELTKKLTC